MYSGKGYVQVKGTEIADYGIFVAAPLINLIKTKRRLLYLKTQSVPRCKHFSSRS